ncbi:SnoaL-like domain protein [compost metagenome]
MKREDLLTLVKSSYAAFAARNINLMCALSTPDCIYEAPGVPEFMPWAHRHAGHEGITQFVATLDEHLIFEHFQPSAFIVDETQDMVVVLGRAECRSRATGRGYVNNWAHLFQLCDGKVSVFREYPDTAAQMLAVHQPG